MKFLKITFGLLFTIVLIVFCIGMFASKAHHSERSDTFNCSRLKLWTTLNDIQDLPKRRKEIKRVEFTGTTKNGLRKWKQYTVMGGLMTMEEIESKPMEKLKVSITESTFGMKGVWTYELSGNDSTFCSLTITEDSEIDKLLLRSLMTILGRDANIKKEINTLKIAATADDMPGLDIGIQ